MFNSEILGTPSDVPDLILSSVFTYRCLVEFVKMEQAAFAEVLPLSMGQLLSLPMILAGIALLGYSLIHSRPKRQSSTVAL